VADPIAFDIPVAGAADNAQVGGDGNNFRFFEGSGLTAFVKAQASDVAANQRHAMWRFQVPWGPNDTINACVMRGQLVNNTRDDPQLKIKGLREVDIAEFAADHNAFTVDKTTTEVAWAQLGVPVGSFDSPSIVPVLQELQAMDGFTADQYVGVAWMGDANINGRDMECLALASNSGTYMRLVGTYTPADEESVDDDERHAPSIPQIGGPV